VTSAIVLRQAQTLMQSSSGAEMTGLKYTV